MVRDKVERRAGELRLSKSWNVIIFPFSAFRVLEETTGTTADDLDEDGAERPRFPWAVMDRRSRPGPELTTLEAVGNQWRYALVVVQAGDDDECLDTVGWTTGRTSSL